MKQKQQPCKKTNKKRRNNKISKETNSNSQRQQQKTQQPTIENANSPMPIAMKTDSIESTPQTSKGSVSLTLTGANSPVAPEMNHQNNNNSNKNNNNSSDVSSHYQMYPNTQNTTNNNNSSNNNTNDNKDESPQCIEYLERPKCLSWMPPENAQKNVVDQFFNIKQQIGKGGEGSAFIVTFKNHTNPRKFILKQIKVILNT